MKTTPASRFARCGGEVYYDIFLQMQRKAFPKKYEDYLVTILRLSIGLIFVWFGLLKVFGYNPVFDLIYHSAFPVFAADTGLIVLGVIETIIGILLFVNRALMVTHVVLLLHLLGTFSTFVFGWQVVFTPHFPVLSLGGEFVVKNMALAIAGLVVLVHESRRARPHLPR